MEIERVNVLGVGISVLNLRTAVEAIAGAVKGRAKGYICVTGVHGVMEAQESADFRHVLNRAFLNTPDGMPMVWMGKLRGKAAMSRVYGPDLMHEVFTWSRESGCRHFFYGGQPGVAEELKRNMEAKYPGAVVCGVYTPPFRPLNADEEAALIATMAKLRPDIIWVGLSTPKQERFMAEYLPKLDTALMVGVGAAFDFYAGRTRQAPRWIQRSGFEWLYRLSQEPGRLWKRYLKNNPLFVMKIIGQLTGLRKYPLGS
ncbi:MAG TPA: WecB/TagA/CpsF family glycosyltransferase [Chthoniobacteraceae bacterium]|nr:WecB/TagA/CpsF family glycosyltransferase [Chthoniobacteraceae bacterium]